MYVPEYISISMKLKFINLYLISRYINFIGVNLNYYMLKSYYRHKNILNHNRIQWTPQFWQPDCSVDYIVDTIIEEGIDILCMSVFVWNSDFTYQIAKKVKEINPSIKILIGGPDVDVLSNNDYFEVHNYVDYVVYGDGEEAFCKILDSILDNTPIKDGVNIVTKEKVYPHRVFFDNDYNTKSNFLSEKDILKKHLLEIREKTNDELVIEVRWERARGCPYACSFCDWSSGLHNKVKRKKSSWKEELDFLFSCPRVLVSPTDANWGMYEEDIEITNYAVDHGSFYVSNVSKLNKDRVYKLYDIMINGKKSLTRRLKLSFQDIHEDVLDNISRPDVPWETHKSLIQDFKKKHPNTHLIAEIIVGLPGQSISKQLNQMNEFRKAGINRVLCFFWEMIPNSPAYKPEYQSTYKIKAESLILINEVQKNFKSIEDVNNAVETGTPGWSKSKIVIGNSTQDFADILTCFALSEVFNKSCEEGDFSFFNDSFVMSIHDHMKLEANNIEKTKVFGIYSKKHNYYVSPNLYFSSLTYNDWNDLYS